MLKQKRNIQSITKQLTFGFIACLISVQITAQTNQKIAAAWSKFQNDSQLTYGAAGIYVMDATTGKVIFSNNGKMGFAPASTTKVLTSIAALDALGANYTYQTGVYLTGSQQGTTWVGNVVIDGSGDPTMGSWRYDATKNNAQLLAICQALKAKNIETIQGNLVVNNKGFDINPIPPYWPYGDIGNYYGAGIWPLNWNENQYDLYFKTSNSIGGSTQLTGQKPQRLPIDQFYNETKTASSTSGDQSIIYTAPFNSTTFIQGSLPASQQNFTVSGAVASGESFMLMNLKDQMTALGITHKGNLFTSMDQLLAQAAPILVQANQQLLQLQSPTLDSMVYWFMKKSINLYGEAFTRTIGLAKENKGTTDAGISWMEQLYKMQGIDIRGMHLLDGSGLSPTNRIAPETLAKALKYAADRPWFDAFYSSLPEYNGMKLKSGTIHRAKAYAGYHKAKNGQKYIVAIMANNYNGSTNAVVQKMFTVLNTLK